MQTTESLQHQAPSGTPTHQGHIFRGDDPRKKNPFYAGLLSFLPGLGQVYVGYYRRGFINILVSGTVFSALVSPQEYQPYMPLGIVFLIFFVLYSVIDASRRATMYNLSLDGVEQIDLPDELTNNALQGSYLGGGALLLFGAIALSYTLFDISLEWLNDLWPIFPMGFGGYLVFKAYKDSQKAQDL